MRHSGTALLILAACPLFAIDPLTARIFQTGVNAMRGSDYPAAEKDFLQVLQSEPQNLGALGNLGFVYSMTDRNARAIQTYQKALRLAPNDKGLLLNLGFAYMRSENYARALPQFAEVVSADPQNLQAEELAATCRIYTGDFDQAILRLEQLKSVEPNKAAVLFLLGVAYSRAQQPQQAKTVFAEMLSSAKTDTVQSNFLLGKAYYESGRFPDAEKAFQDVLSEDPEFPRARLELAKVFICERKTTNAIEQLNVILEKEPSDSEAEYFLGALQVQSLHYEPGVLHLQAAEKSYPDSWALNFFLGKAAVRRGRTEEGIRHLRKAAELNPDESSIYSLLAQAYKLQGSAAEASEALDKGKSLRGKSVRKEDMAIDRVPGPQ